MLRCVQCTVHSSHTEFTTVFFTVGPFWMNINFNMQSYVNACGGTNNFHSMDSLPSVWSTSKQIYHSCTGQPSTNDLSQQSLSSSFTYGTFRNHLKELQVLLNTLT